MKRLCTLLLLTAWGLSALAADKSRTIVYINGAKYYIHTVQAGETLYGLSKLYGVGEKVILENNPTLNGGLRSDVNIRIPVIGAVGESQPSDRKLRKTFDFHFVAKGETLYAISRQYEIPVNTIIEDNPGIDPTHLRLGSAASRSARRTRPAACSSGKSTGSRSTAWPTSAQPTTSYARARPSIRSRAASESPRPNWGHSTAG